MKLFHPIAVCVARAVARGVDRELMVRGSFSSAQVLNDSKSDGGEGVSINHPRVQDGDVMTPLLNGMIILAYEHMCCIFGFTASRTMVMVLFPLSLEYCSNCAMAACLF
jgi:hypothetical protein